MSLETFSNSAQCLLRKCKLVNPIKCTDVLINSGVEAGKMIRAPGCSALTSNSLGRASIIQ